MDKLYWENYYKRHTAPVEPSRFAQFIMGQYVTPGQKLIELGCGNGRDATYFGANGVHVLAVDQAASEVNELNVQNVLPNVHFEAGDFTNLEDGCEGYDVVYSRFTLHSVEKQEQTRTLGWAARNLVDGGYLCIEVRGQKNSLFGKGVPVEGQSDAYIFDDHYRRFLDQSVLDSEVEDLGMHIVESEEAQGFAPYGGEDDFFIRQISRK